MAYYSKNLKPNQNCETDLNSRDFDLLIRCLNLSVFKLGVGEKLWSVYMSRHRRDTKFLYFIYLYLRQLLIYKNKFYSLYREQHPRIIYSFGENNSNQFQSYKGSLVIFWCTHVFLYIIWKFLSKLFQFSIYQMINDFFAFKNYKKGIKVLMNFEKTVIQRNKSHLDIKYIFKNREHKSSSNEK